MKSDIDQFCDRHGVELFILFGSRATGKPHSASDCDIALQFPKGREVSPLLLIYELGFLFPAKDIDLVVLTPETDPLLLHEVFTHGRLLFERSEGLFQKAGSRAWHLYLDTARLRQKEREYVKRKIEDLTNVT